LPALISKIANAHWGGVTSGREIEMWSDSETNRDFLNFRAVANTAAEIVVQAKGNPLSLGVCGSWGVGKSSMLMLLREELAGRKDQTFVFVEFNAWLYQGYDDARAALMEVIAQNLLAYAEDHKKPTERILEFLRRVRWARVAGLTASVAASFAVGAPLPGVASALIGAYHTIAQQGATPEALAAAKEAGKGAAEAGKGMLAEKNDDSPPKEIQQLRDHFEATLKELGATLVVFIDDLDRCLPATAIATLEAIRLFLFLEHTAFVIAADDKMIRQAVRVHFKEIALDDDLITNYFDKLIQVPIRVPPLGTQDVRAYLMLLFIENSSLPQEKRNELREAICTQLGKTWQGKRVDRAFVLGLIQDCPPQLAAQLDLADRLAPLMTSSEKIAGNPRLIKRFLNTLSIRLSIARAQQVTVDEAALAKMLLFERCAPAAAHLQLISSINADDEGKPALLKDWEDAARRGEKSADVKGDWDSPFVQEWLALSPPLAELDLRAIVYVSREHLPIITPDDNFSSEAADLLAALLAIRTQQSDELTRRMRNCPKREVGQIMDRILTNARRIQEWGTPPILYAALTVAAVDNDLGAALASFLRQLPPGQLTPALVPLLSGRPWAAALLAHWAGQPETPGPVKRAIQRVQTGASR
jgi:predicted KAP-like P-loop ATPase